ncbi:hypothetical protein NPIL_297041 [Nephila pilipes]|uniref:Uncharacterized protein n=1 Tax=Nephila pilipes TaxID=299642 RepID=A0A8X6PWE0_NEPPI|nr:hypothetical protein NPIL_297041 [Nephila pilipes]
MDSIQTTSTETTQAVSIPTILALVNVINHSDQCLHADTKLAEYISQIPDIQFSSQEEKNNYSTELFSIQEEVRSKYNTLKHEELRLENAKYKDLVSSWGLPDATKPQQFQLQSRRKNSTPVKNIINKRQKTTETTECTNKFSDLIIEEPPEQIEIDDDEDVTPPPPKKSYAPPITIDNEKRESRTSRPVNHTTPTTYAEAAKSSPVALNQAASTSPPPTSNSSVTDIFNQLKDPECLEMFGILKKYIEISKSATTDGAPKKPSYPIPKSSCSTNKKLVFTSHSPLSSEREILLHRPMCSRKGTTSYPTALADKLPLGESRIHSHWPAGIRKDPANAVTTSLTP